MDKKLHKVTTRIILFVSIPSINHAFLLKKNKTKDKLSFQIHA